MTKAEIARGLASWELLIQNSRQSTRYLERAAARSAADNPVPSRDSARGSQGQRRSGPQLVIPAANGSGESDIR